MNDRCRVFALNGEELFPCRWAKAKKLVAANVAEKIVIDGKMCIKMLEPTRMNKPQEAIMNNEISEVSFKFPEKLYKYCVLETRLLDGDSIYEFDLYKIDSETAATYITKEDFRTTTQQLCHTVLSCEINCDFLGNYYPFRTSLEDAQKDLGMHIDKLNVIKSSISKIPPATFIVGSNCVQQSDGAGNTTWNIVGEIKQEDDFKFPDTLYQFNWELNAINVFKFEGIDWHNIDGIKTRHGVYIIKSKNSTETIYVRKDHINDFDFCSLLLNSLYFFRTTLSSAIKDFESFRQESLKRLRKELLHFELTKIPQIIE